MFLQCFVGSLMKTDSTQLNHLHDPLVLGHAQAFPTPVLMNEDVIVSVGQSSFATLASVAYDVFVIPQQVSLAVVPALLRGARVTEHLVQDQKRHSSSLRNALLRYGKMHVFFIRTSCCVYKMGCEGIEPQRHPLHFY